MNIIGAGIIGIVLDINHIFYNTWSFWIIIVTYTIVTAYYKFNSER